MLGKKVLIISRHPATVDFLKEVFEDFEIVVKPHLETTEVPEEEIIVGNLPLNLIEKLVKAGKRFIYIAMSIPQELRGRELNSEQVKEYIELYEIKELKLEKW